MLRQEAVVPYLLRRGFITASDVVHRDIVVSDVSRRCCVFRVTATRHRSWILKQGFDVSSRQTVRNEGVVYEWLGKRGPNRHLNGLAPELLAYDERESVLILEGLPSAQSFRDYQLSRPRFSKTLARRLGESLGHLHSVAPDAAGESPTQLSTCQAPWVLSIHRPYLQQVHGFSVAAVELIRIAQDSRELCAGLDSLRRAWRQSSLIHGDIKWDNCLVFPAPGSRRITRLRLIDWELAGLGDPMWDVGSVLSEYLLAWLHSIPTRGESGNRPIAQAALRPLGVIRPAVHAFLEAYLRASKNGKDPDGLFLSAVRFAAAKMIQAHLEQLQNAHGLTAHAILGLQLSANTLGQPRTTLQALLGLRA